MQNYGNFKDRGLAEIGPSLDLKRSLLKLAKAAFLRSLMSFVVDWALMLLAVAAVLSISLFLLPFALVLIGSRQRALSNLVHDASHGNLSGKNMLNDLVADYLGALPNFDTVRSYRQSHMQHHRYLGSLRDPDSLAHLSYEYDDRKPVRGSALRLYFRLLLNFRSWRDSMVGGLFSLSSLERLKVLCFWISFTGLISVIFSSTMAWTFVMFWLVSRGTSFHAIRIFAEFLDHTGLSTGSVTGFSRNLPSNGILRWVLHPHEDTYHLVHHLAPRVPHYNLRKAHDLLSGFPAYLEAHHCDSYFKGKHSAVDCWIGNCEREVQR